MSMVKVDWNPDAAALGRFGRTVFIGFTLIGLAVWFFGGSYDAGAWGPLPWFIGISAAVWLLAVAAPAAARPIYLVWMSVGFVMGTVISTILLAAIYWILFGFVALCFRIRGRDRLRIRSAPAEGKGWVDRSGPVARERYQRQF
jgi:hypothetical protein